jgi:hypothetical protein
VTGKYNNELSAKDNEMMRAEGNHNERMRELQNEIQ